MHNNGTNGDGAARVGSDELDALLRVWHADSVSRVAEGRERLVAALGADMRGPGSLDTSMHPGQAGVRGPGSSGRADPLKSRAQTEAPAVLSFRNPKSAIRNPVLRYSPALAAMVAIGVLTGILMPTHQTATYADSGNVVLAPEGGRLDALDEDGNVLGPCALKRTDVDVDISAFFSRVTVRQTYHNPFDDKIEAVYTFPLSHRAAVDRMTMTIGDRVVVGEVHERQAARAIYDAARESGHVAGLLEHERPNIFTQSVANIEPNAEVLIEISYVETLERRDGWYSFDFPMVVSPRYIPSYASGETLPPGLTLREGLTLLAPADVQILQAGQANTPGLLRPEQLSGLVHAANPIEPPDTARYSTGQPDLWYQFTATYADGSKDIGTLHTDGTGQIDGRWFYVDPNSAVVPVSNRCESLSPQSSVLSPDSAAVINRCEPGEPLSGGTDRVPDAARITPRPVNPPMRSGHDIAFSISIDTGGPGIVDVGSESHELVQIDEAVRDDGLPSAARLTLKQEREIPNRDLVFSWRQTSDTIQEALFTHTGERGNFFTLILQPPEMSGSGEADEGGRSDLQSRPHAEGDDSHGESRVQLASHGESRVQLAPTGVGEEESRVQLAPTAAALARELIFVLDTSGSMQGFPIEKAKEVMSKAIDAMRPDDTFNMITFSGDTHVLWDAPQPNTPDNVAHAQAFLQSREGGGGTEMMKAIEAALAPGAREGEAPAREGEAPAEPARREARPPDEAPAEPDGGMPVRIVMFLTDGCVGNDMEIIDSVKRHAATTRVFSFGVGNSPNRYLLDGMARAGRGEVEYVLLESDANAAVERFTRRIESPVLADISIAFDANLSVDDILCDTPFRVERVESPATEAATRHDDDPTARDAEAPTAREGEAPAAREGEAPAEPAAAQSDTQSSIDGDDTGLDAESDVDPLSAILDLVAPQGQGLVATGEAERSEAEPVDDESLEQTAPAGAEELSGGDALESRSDLEVPADSSNPQSARSSPAAAGNPQSVLYPADLFDSKPIIVHGRYTSPGRGRLTIRGRTAGGPYERTIDLDLPESQPEHDVIATLWARTKVDSLLNEDLAAVQSGQVPDTVRQQVIDLGETFQIMTQFTSFVAVEQLRVTVGGQPRLVHIPVELPDGMSYEGAVGEGLCAWADSLAAMSQSALHHDVLYDDEAEAPLSRDPTGERVAGAADAALNVSGQLDVCDIGDGSSVDAVVTSAGVPDECSAESNTNGVPDETGGAFVDALRMKFEQTSVPEVRWETTTLESTIEWLRSYSGAPINVNWRALEAAGIEKDAEVTLKLNDVPLQEVFNRLLDQVGGGETALDYAIKDGVMSISTREDLGRRMLAQTYNVGDVLANVPDFNPRFDLNDFQSPAGQAAQGSGGGGLGGGGGGEVDPAYLIPFGIAPAEMADDLDPSGGAVAGATFSEVDDQTYAWPGDVNENDLPDEAGDRANGTAGQEKSWIGTSAAGAGSIAEGDQDAANISEAYELGRHGESLESTRERQISALKAHAEELRKKRKYEEAIWIYEEVLGVDPTDEDAAWRKTVLEDFHASHGAYSTTTKRYKQTQSTISKQQQASIPWHQDLVYPKKGQEIAAARGQILGVPAAQPSAATPEAQQAANSPQSAELWMLILGANAKPKLFATPAPGQHDTVDSFEIVGQYATPRNRSVAGGSYLIRGRRKLPFPDASQVGVGRRASRVHFHPSESLLNGGDLLRSCVDLGRLAKCRTPRLEEIENAKANLAKAQQIRGDLVAKHQASLARQRELQAMLQKHRDKLGATRAGGQVDDSAGEAESGADSFGSPRWDYSVESDLVDLAHGAEQGTGQVAATGPANVEQAAARPVVLLCDEHAILHAVLLAIDGQSTEARRIACHVLAARPDFELAADLRDALSNMVATEAYRRTRLIELRDHAVKAVEALAGRLRSLARRLDERLLALAMGERPASPPAGVHVTANGVLVSVLLEKQESAAADRLRRAGLVVEDTVESMPVVIGAAPLDRLADIALCDGVRRVVPADPKALSCRQQKRAG